MARKLDLRTAATELANGGQQLAYGELMLAILRTPAPGRGVTLDEMIRLLAVVEPIEQAIGRAQPAVTLTDEQWAVLRQKLDEFQFAFVDKEICRFGEAIRAAPEIGVEALPPRLNGGEVRAPIDG
jgi:hypothetical protein